MHYTVELAASDSHIEYEGGQREAHAAARRLSAQCGDLFRRYGYMVRDPRGNIEAIWREGQQWQCRTTDGLWSVRPLFDD